MFLWVSKRSLQATPLPMSSEMRRAVEEAFDAVDGSGRATGKTTLCHALVKHYEEKGLRCLFAPEFSSSFVGKGILDIVDDRRFFRMDRQKARPLIADLMVLIADVFCKYELEAAPDADVVIMERGIISALGYQLIRLFRAMPETRDAWIPARSATRLREADLDIFSKLGKQGLEWRLEPEAFTGREVGGEDDLLDFPVGCPVDIEVARQPSA